MRKTSQKKDPNRWIKREMRENAERSGQNTKEEGGRGMGRGMGYMMLEMLGPVPWLQHCSPSHLLRLRQQLITTVRHVVNVHPSHMCTHMPLTSTN